MGKGAFGALRSVLYREVIVSLSTIGGSTVRIIRNTVKHLIENTFGLPSCSFKRGYSGGSYQRWFHFNTLNMLIHY